MKTYDRCDPRYSALDAGEPGHNTLIDFKHNDHDICKAFKASQPLSESMFYSQAALESKQPDPIPEKVVESALGAAAALGLIIPGIGHAIFGIGTIASFVCRVDELHQPGPGGPDKFTLMKIDLLTKIKESQLIKYRGKLTALLDLIQTRADKHEDVFNRVASADYLVVLDTYNLLVSNAYDVKDAESSLLVMLEVLEKQYRWADNDIEQTIIVLVPFLVQCMELRLVLAANLHDICKASVDHQADADRYVTDFQVNLDFVSVSLKRVAIRMRAMIVAQRKYRRGLFDGKVTAPTKVHSRPMEWTFSDGFSGRTFSYSRFPADAYLDDIYSKTNSYINEIAAWYGQQLQAHCERHLTVLENVVARWETVAAALDTYWNTKPGKPGHPLNGRLMYKQMSALAAKADKEASGDKPVS